MKAKAILKYVVVCAAMALIAAANASAQWSPGVKVSGTIENSASVGAPAPGISIARCGNNIVAGFGDSESGNTNSFGGVAVSHNGGASFVDLGVVPVPVMNIQGFGPDTLDGEIAVACGTANLFYYAADYIANNEPALCPAFPECESISVSTSNNGGSSWNDPVIVAAASRDTHVLMSPSVAADPTNPQRVYVAYIYWNTSTPFDFTFPDCTNADISNGIFIIQMTSSADGGKTWTPPVNAAHTCAGNTNTGEPILVTPNVVVSPNGNVNVAYAFEPHDSQGTPNEILFTRSVDHGQTFSAPVKVSNDSVVNAQPRLGVDRSSTARRGELYLIWSGKPFNTFTDAMISDSLDGGLSFSFPRPISPFPGTSSGRYQVNPVVAVDNDGQVGACFYNTNNSQPTSSSVYSYECAVSFNHAASWTKQQLLYSAPAGFDSVTSDFLLQNDGLFTAYEAQNSSGQRHVVGQKADNP